MGCGKSKAEEPVAAALPVVEPIILDDDDAATPKDSGDLGALGKDSDDAATRKDSGDLGALGKDNDLDASPPAVMSVAVDFGLGGAAPRDSGDLDASGEGQLVEAASPSIAPPAGAPPPPVPPVPVPPARPSFGGQARKCKWGEKCRLTTEEHRQQFWHPGDEGSEPELPACRYGTTCKMYGDQDHCSNYSHPAKKEIRRFSGILPPCKFGQDCKMKDDRLHLENFSHPDVDLDLSLETDQKVGSKYPFVKCVNHPGCPKRWSCWYTHGEIEVGDMEGVSRTCFFGQQPYNGDCSNGTPGNKPFSFCSKTCRQKAIQSQKGPMGCRRANCPCPCTISGLAGQFCSKVCELGTACKEATHLVPTAHLHVVAKAEPGKYSPCARQGCACASEGGSSWNGEAGQFCSRACRNGTGCTKQWHTVPEQVADKFLEEQRKALARPTCTLPGCDEATFNGREGEFCSLEHRREHQKRLMEKLQAERAEAARREAEAAAAAAAAAEAERLAREAAAQADAKAKALAEEFLRKAQEAAATAKAKQEEERRRAAEAAEKEKFSGLWIEAEQWGRRSGAGAKKGAVSGIWFNESLKNLSCPARISFDKACAAAGIGDWSDGEFGWHGTKSRVAVAGICWDNWSTKHRSGQAFGPGEYFSRGTLQGLHYSEGYAGGDAADLLIVAWIMGHTKGAAPKDPGTNGANNGATNGHIVCNNPVGAENVSTGLMYCVPIAVVAFGGNTTPPAFKQ